MNRTGVAWETSYAPYLGMPGVRKLRAETAKADAEHSMYGKDD
jgi:hypothetical protein